MLWGKKTRLLGFILLVLFNLTNNWFFNIGVFPVLMIGATVLFLEPETPRKWVQKFFRILPAGKVELIETGGRYKLSAIIFVSIYLSVQVLVPLRHFLYPGRASWTEEGHYFAWRMKLRSKRNCQINFVARR